jgi:hypothetical protein
MRYALIIVFCSASLTVCGQKLPAYGINRVRIADTSKMTVAEIIPVERSIRAAAADTYYWYGANQIQHTQGGYSGKLLNGLYTEFYLNKNLKEEGRYQEGLKSGTWKEWRADGSLIRSTGWKAGNQSGLFLQYDENGRLISEGYYSKGLPEGVFHYYRTADSASTEYYHHGKKTLPPRSWFKRLKFLRKKGKDSVRTSSLPVSPATRP